MHDFCPVLGSTTACVGINVGFQPKDLVVFTCMIRFILTLPLTTDYIERLSFSGFKILFARYKTGNVRPYI